MAILQRIKFILYCKYRSFMRWIGRDHTLEDLEQWYEQSYISEIPSADIDVHNIKQSYEHNYEHPYQYTRTNGSIHRGCSKEYMLYLLKLHDKHANEIKESLENITLKYQEGKNHDESK